MTTDPIPPHLQGPIHNLNDALGRLRTTRIRASQIEIPDEDPPSAQELADAVDRPDAPPQLRAVAAAVHDGRTSWEAILEMGVAAAVERFPRQPVAAKQVEPTDDELEDFSEMTIMREGW